MDSRLGWVHFKNGRTIGSISGELNGTNLNRRDHHMTTPSFNVIGKLLKYPLSVIWHSSIAEAMHT